MNNDTLLITKYISAWNYQLLAIMSLFFCFLFLAIGGLISNVFLVALFLVFAFCEYKSFKMRQEVLEE